jgi:serine/threonine protein phosphatase PrpC
VPDPAAAAVKNEVRWEVAGETDPGRVRSHNEDALLLAPEYDLVCVCDGMGGHACGEVASGMAVATLREFFAYATADADSTWPFKMERGLSLEANRLTTAIRMAAVRIFENSRRNDVQRGMGTTIVAASLGPSRLAVAHAGDSRAYLIRGGKIDPLTRDHSLLQEYIAARRPSAEEIASFPHKNVITRALGLDPAVRPEIVEIPVERGDVLLLCCDGLHGMLSDERIAQLVGDGTDLNRAARELVAAANDAGGVDNITVALARLA